MRDSLCGQAAATERREAMAGPSTKKTPGDQITGGVEFCSVRLRALDGPLAAKAGLI